MHLKVLLVAFTLLFSVNALGFWYDSPDFIIIKQETTVGLEVDTNAQTACNAGEVLYGDGTCQVPAGGSSIDTNAWTENLLNDANEFQQPIITNQTITSASGTSNLFDINVQKEINLNGIVLENTINELKITPNPSKTTAFFNFEIVEVIAGMWYVPTISAADNLFGNIMAIKDRIYVVDNTNPQIYFSNVINSANAFFEYDVANDWIEIVNSTGLWIRGDNVPLYIGISKDASFYYDGSNAYINPKEVGSGSLVVEGDLNVTGDLHVDGNLWLNSPNGTYFSCDITNGGIFQCT